VSRTPGIIAAGHEETAKAGAQVLAAGGNAFDAALAALCAACVAEPVLASLGGGGFLMARRADGRVCLYDFFSQTPGRRRAPADCDFFPLDVDFGDTTQEFHVGMGSIAVPGVVAGIAEIQRDLCRLPLTEITAPARHLARGGVELNAFQHDLATIVEPILRVSPACFALHASPSDPQALAEPGARLHNRDLADTLELLGREGALPFYDGELARRLAADCTERGGHLRLRDLQGYRVIRREPLIQDHRGARIHINPPPSLGGPLIRFALSLLDATEPAPPHHEAERIHRLAHAMRLTQDLRSNAPAQRADTPAPDQVAHYRALMREHAVFTRGTTQISCADAEGNLASLTTSNGEGCGYCLPGTGIVMNNMLGEEDINPHGFHRWPEDRRIGSMMSPTLVALPGGGWAVVGSSGSNRIRSAILQVLCNLIEGGMSVEAAVTAPRIHFEHDTLNLEPPVAEPDLERLAHHWPSIRPWRAKSLYFGGAHSVLLGADGRLTGAGDPRRSGAVRVVD